jgi:Spy/CpxP family protein refolding chaperone
MKQTRTIHLFLCLLALGSTAPVLRAEAGDSAKGQREHHPKGNPGERMKKELGLTADQSEKMKAIHQDSEAQLKALRENTALSPEEKKAAVRQIREATKAKVDAILTPEQAAKIEKMREGAKKHIKERRVGKDGEEAPGEKGAKGEKHGKPGLQ